MSVPSFRGAARGRKSNRTEMVSIRGCIVHASELNMRKAN